MQQQTKNNLKALSKAMKPLCSNCEIHIGRYGKINTSKPFYRCCESFFCKIAQDGFKVLGVHYEPTGHKELLFMGPKGCIVPPEHRPLCTLFACPMVKQAGGKSFQKLYKKLEEKIKLDPQIKEAIYGKFRKATVVENNQGPDKTLEDVTGIPQEMLNLLRGRS